MLIVGDPGIGKSAFVAEMIHRNPGGQVLAYHVCRADDPETLRPSTFVMSLAGMIAGRLPAFADLLEAPKFQELFDPKSVSSRPAHIFDQGLIAGLHQLPAPTDGIRYVLIDALDEALPLGDAQLNIVTLLSTRLDRFPPWLRIVATTRREPDVLNRLGSLRAASIDAHRQDNLDDIDRFIQARLQTPNLAERLAASLIPLATVQRKLRDKADGNFLYVSQALQDIERDSYSFGRLDELPQGLNQWYEAWFSRKFPNPKTDFIDARKVLEVILAAREPLTFEFISIVTGIEDYYVLNDVLSALSPFVQKSRTVYGIYHKSLADWAITPSGRYHVSITNGNRLLGGFCLENLTGRSFSSHRTFALKHGARHLIEAKDATGIECLLNNDTVVDELLSRLLSQKELVEHLRRSDPGLADLRFFGDADDIGLALGFLESQKQFAKSSRIRPVLTIYQSEWGTRKGIWELENAFDLATDWCKAHPDDVASLLYLFRHAENRNLQAYLDSGIIDLFGYDLCPPPYSS